MRNAISRRFLVTFTLVLIGFAATTFVTNSFLVGELHRETMESALRQRASPGILAECQANPSDFALDALGVGQVTALDAQGKPLSPPVPTLPSPLPTPDRGQLIGVNLAGWGPDWAAVYGTGTEGACSAWLLYEPKWMGVGRGFLLSHGLKRLGVISILVLGAWGVAVRPVMRRLERMANQTAEIVHSGFAGELAVVGDDELDALSVAFNQATRAARDRLALLEARDRLTREVIANVAHDVRTPLAALKLGVSRLLADHPRPESQAMVLSELGYLDGLIANISALVELEGTGLELVKRPLDGRDLVLRAVARFTTIASGRGIEVHSAIADDELTLDGDSVALEQALGNLVHNAVEYATGNVAVVAFADGERIVFEVRDDGPGVDQVEIPRLSERRFRGQDSRTRGRSGKGLGLAIASEVMRRHGGTLSLARHDEGGTVATLVLPRRVVV